MQKRMNYSNSISRILKMFLVSIVVVVGAVTESLLISVYIHGSACMFASFVTGISFGTAGLLVISHDIYR